MMNKLGKSNGTHKAIFIALCVFTLCMSLVLSIFIGSRNIQVDTVIEILKGNITNSLEQAIVNDRIVRTMFSMIAGAGLSMSGVLMQAATKNPVADPTILGVNVGCALFVVLGISILKINTSIAYIIFSLIGGILTFIVVYFVSKIGVKKATATKLALTGVAVSSALSSLVSAVVLINPELTDKYRFWQVGSVAKASMDHITLTLPVVVICIIVSIGLIKLLNILSMGDDIATTLGVKVSSIRFLVCSIAVILCSVVTALAGPIGFIGLMAPHIVRLIFGSDYKYIATLSPIVGAIVLTISDVIGRYLGSPGELEVGIVTAFIGAPILLLLAMRSKETSM